MLKQMTFSDIDRCNINRITRKDKFLNERNSLVPFAEWISIIEPYYSKIYLYLHE